MENVRIAIVGSGFSGLGMAIRLKQSGVEDFVIFERANDVGGTWRDNTYPGCACDVESNLYSFSFAPNPNWTRQWPLQAEILQYLRDCADKFGIRPHLKFGHTFEKAEWDVKSRKWLVTFSGKLFSCDVLISAMGALTVPKYPEIPGLENFRGKVIHTTQWDHNYSLDGKSVAVVGTGASAIQVVPAIQPRVKKLHLFQRTPAWVLPQRNREFSAHEKARFARFPWRQKLSRFKIYLTNEVFGLGFRYPKMMSWLDRFARRYLSRKIKDRGLREKLTPRYQIGCKRVLVSSLYYPAVQQSNVEVVTDRIATFTAEGVKTADDKNRPVDAIILATGFDLSDIHCASRIRGRSGKTLREVWSPSPRAYLGTTVADFPNLFILFGPNTGLGHTSVIYMLESQVAHVIAAIRFMRRKRIEAVEPKPAAQVVYNESLDKRMDKTVWKSGCSSWYLDPSGRNSTLWPGTIGQFRRQARRFRADHYEMNP